MKIELNKFKKIKVDKHSTTLRHPDGHEIKVSHAALTPKYRSQLHALPMMEGDEKPQKLAHGGEPKPQPSPTPKADNPFAAGIDPEKAKKFHPFKDGGEVEVGGNAKSEEASTKPGDESSPSASETPQAGAEQPPVTVNINDKPVIPSQYQNPAVESQPEDPTLQNVQHRMQQLEAQNQPPAQQTPSQQQAADDLPIPANSAEAVALQMKGVKDFAQAAGNLGSDQAQLHLDSAKAQQTLMDNHQKALQQIQNDYETEMKYLRDPANAVSPDKYWQNHSKIMAGIGLLLGGFNPTSRPNGALEFLNKQIDDNVKAQQANMDTHHNILRAALQHYGDINQATAVTKALLTGKMADMIAAKAAESQSPMAKAEAEKMIGQLHLQNSALLNQEAMRKALAATQAQASQAQAEQDPATVAGLMRQTGMINDKQYTEVSKEIERAQNTARQEANIKSLFRQAYDDMSGAGAATSLVKEPRSRQALAALLNTTVTDLTGTARQAEFDNIQKNLLPSVYDTDRDKAIKARALDAYLQAKKSAPISKGLGLDLERYKSTHIGGPKFGPQEQAMYDWAKQNPGNPKAAMVMKRLGISQ